MSDGALPLTDPTASLQTALSQMPQGAQGNVPPPMAPPNVGPDTATQIAQQPPPNLGIAQNEQSQQSQPPKQSAVPALAGFLQQKIKGPGYEQ